MGNINYPPLKNISLNKIYGNYAYFSIINQLQKPMYIIHGKTLHFVGIFKPKGAQLQSPAHTQIPAVGDHVS